MATQAIPTPSDAAMEALLARKADAEISFKAGVFVEEFIFNFFGIFSVPFVLWRKGKVGAQNRLLLSTQSLLTNLIWTSMLYGFVVLHAIFNGTPGYIISNFEVMLVFLLWTARSATIGVKWAFFSTAQVAEFK
jgi:hypothetical protein